ncbi:MULTISPECIES: class I SAM-dependent methyltransferase [Micromonospora]|uniref:Class I SAM-dependent methyltransferase n=1 Tax=Micromonospora solifontis TaxID=2487138 RepID=A0ABX9WM58_9ACTN|nr:MULTISPECIES: class I SAM-dependent methyltransferase [Micromonospora]NES12869.1 class I SAM-dependent methyltransferase [Micromonospora sp. PPF5-17B]NES34813.1 class I SAM-dependent methyltransferase [Micromonospora solifontis]NES54794.1 class I SAM-dependent methyltransferase [Micromonospora sp. PPF5-6]RNM01708.1 class I SAM-dependent methyltransferase [Micromonospora solifontis]
MIEPAWLTETRAAYDTVAVDYARLIPEVLEGPLDRGMLAAFAELVGPGRPVLEVGCGTGRITAHLHGLGLDIAGVDLSPGMIEVARRSYPELRFEIGSMTDLAAPDGALAGLVAWYSIIHLPPALLPGVFAGFHRVLAPGGHLLVAVKAGDQRIRLREAYGHRVEYDVYWLPPEQLAVQLTAAGFTVHATLVRQAEVLDRGPQAFLLATRPADAGEQR